MLIFQVDDDDYDGVFKVPFVTILKLSAPEWKYLLVGCIGSGLFGAYPFLFGISFGGISDVCINLTLMVPMQPLSVYAYLSIQFMARKRVISEVAVKNRIIQHIMFDSFTCTLFNIIAFFFHRDACANLLHEFAFSESSDTFISFSCDCALTV